MKTPKLDPGEYCGENRMDFSNQGTLFAKSDSKIVIWNIDKKIVIYMERKKKCTKKNNEICFNQ